MKIAVDLTSLADNFSGIERYAANMARSILRNGPKDKFVLVFKDFVFPWFEEFRGREEVEICVIPSARWGKAAFSQIRLPWALRHIEPDLVLFLAFPCPLLYRAASLSVVHDISCHDCPDTMTLKSRLMWRMLDGLAVADNRQVITVSEFSKARITEYYRKDPTQVTVAYCGIDHGLFNKHVGVGCEVEVSRRYNLPRHFFLSLSTIEPRKRLDLLVAAWAELWREGAIDQDLVLAGREGWKVGSLLSSVDLGVRAHIHFIGFVQDADLAVLYRMADAFVFPSRYEGFGLPPVEAQASGAHVLCSDIPSLQEICQDRAAYFRSGDKADLKRALTDPHLFDQVNNELLGYSWDAGATTIMSLFRRVEDLGGN